MSSNIDRELQIDIASLQAEMDVNLAVTFSLSAVVVAVFVTFEQLFWTAEMGIHKTIYLWVGVASFISLSIILIIGLYKINRIRADIVKLKQQYVKNNK